MSIDGQKAPEQLGEILIRFRQFIGIYCLLPLRESGITYPFAYPMKTDSFYLWINRETRAACLSACFDTHLLLPKKLYAYTNKLQRDWNQKAPAFCYRLRNHLYSQVCAQVHASTAIMPLLSSLTVRHLRLRKWMREICNCWLRWGTSHTFHKTVGTLFSLISSANNRFSSAERNSEISPAGTLSSCIYKM